MDSDTDDTDTDNESNIDVRAQVAHGNGYDRQPPTVPAAQLALQDLTSLLHPPSQKLNGQKAGDALSKTPLDPDTLAQLEDIRNFLWWYCDFNANDKPKSLSAGFWIKGFT